MTHASPLRALLLLLLAAPAIAQAPWGQTVTEDAEIQGQLLDITVPAGFGSPIERMLLKATGNDLAGPEGLLFEGFGVGSDYVPNRRLNERLAVGADSAGNPQLRYIYDCDGPNIAGLRVTRIIEPLPREASVRVRWRVENRGEDAQWVVPWVRNDFTPGGAIGASDRLDLPTMDGLLQATDTGWHAAARNWAAATDPVARETVYAVFDAEDTFGFLAETGAPGRPAARVQTAFVPRRMDPGDSWETVYRVNAVRGLEHVNFAASEMAGQVDYEDGALVLRLAAATLLPDLRLDAEVVSDSGERFPLPPKQFQLEPGLVIRCSYEWQAPGDGFYRIVGRLSADGRPFPLSSDLNVPMSGIDAVFAVGRAGALMLDSWTDAPWSLERGPRQIERDLAVGGAFPIWFESPMHKVSQHDVPQATGARKTTQRIRLARGEGESFQLALRTPPDRGLRDLRVSVGNLVHPDSGSTLTSGEAVSVHRIAFHRVDLPSYFEGPTGLFPDALPPFAPITVPPDTTVPVWIDVQAPRDATPGVYLGTVQVRSPDLDPIDLALEVEVLPFSLPQTPRFRTDFGLDTDAAWRDAQRAGYTGSRDALLRQYRALASTHRLTLRELAQMPSESADYAASLRAFAAELPALKAAGITTIAVPPSLLDAPEQLRLANAFVKEHGLEDIAFCHFSHEPQRPAWPRLVDRLNAWNGLAPDIPIMVTTNGLEPFIPDALDIWGIHLPVYDTTTGGALLTRASEGGSVWWYVDHAPPRPYGNLFLDFAGIEHRVLFWQAWALGVKGMHHWAVNVNPDGQDPWQSQIDVTPANGNGMLIYPGPNGPVPSIRLAAVRDGLEDYEYLVLLGDLLAEADSRGIVGDAVDQGRIARNLQTLIPNLVGFSRDPAVLSMHRNRIADAIIALQTRLGR